MGNTGSFYLGHLSLSNIYLSFKMNNQHFVIGIIYLKRILFIVPRPVVVRYTSGVHFEDLDTREIIFRDGKYFSCIRNIFKGRDFFSVSSFNLVVIVLPILAGRRSNCRYIWNSLRHWQRFRGISPNFIIYTTVLFRRSVYWLEWSD